MSNTSETTASPRLRIIFAVAAAIMLSLWAWSLVPPIENWGNPNEDGFSYVGVFYTTITCLPVALYLLVGAIAAHGQYVRRARIAFFVAAGITILVVAFLIVQHIANNNDGKVLGVQIGLRLDRLHVWAEPPMSVSGQTRSSRPGSLRVSFSPKSGTHFVGSTGR